ncbi:alpha/beta fold hydrolase [Georgenia muralis]|uniref:Pimeloyl-ACP methyl ester carboxylesterase n=1 Tax=Georgenia muralis TaxID=154117 RepID=A0A3N4YX39_9MICO|nr:alpha/beta hydrolase [Georgenia muralis]RPF25779.1 pimeloyl-ACP methyl ester carboxylesterase [Georgenia muralis]
MSLALHHHGPDSDLPLVLLHGFPLDSSMWDDVVSHLPDLRVVTVDAPGFGSSPAGSAVSEALGHPRRPALTTYADAVAAALDGAGIGRGVVAGLSMGGYAVLALAERHRGLLAGIGLLDTRAGADDETARRNRLKVAEAALGAAGSSAVAPMLEKVVGPTTLAERPEVVERLRAALAAAPPGGIAWAQHAMANRPGRLAVLRDLDVPALVLRGAEDEMSPQAAAEEMAHALTDVEVVVVPRAGHMSALEAPAEVAVALHRLHERAAQR